MKRIYEILIVFCVLFLSACENKIDENIISKGSDFSAEAREKSQNLDKESYKDLAHLFLDTNEIDFSRGVLIIFGKNQCKYCDMLKDDIKKNPAVQGKIGENFNAYYINTSYQKTHKIFGNSSLTQSSREFEKFSLDEPLVLSRSNFSAQPTNLAQDTRIAEDTIDSKDSSLRASEASVAIQDSANAESNKSNTDSANHAKNAESNKNLADSAISIETQELAQLFGVNLTPQVVFIKEGKVKYLFAGYILNFEKVIDEVIANSAESSDFSAINERLDKLLKGIK
ncbi:thioredoxin fold domain-containing protein [Helicobacter sp. 23-1045]